MEDKVTHSKFWKFFSSIKLSVCLLLALAVISIVGTVIPQNEVIDRYTEIYGVPLAKILYYLGAYDLYHSLGYRFLLLLLTLNIIICSLSRLSQTWKIIFPQQTKYQASQFNHKDLQVKWIDPGPMAQIKEQWIKRIESKFRHCDTQMSQTELTIYGERGRWTRLGVYCVHVSILFMIMGGLIGSYFGFEGFVMIPEGESVNSVTLKNNGKTQPLGFVIRCDNFDVSYYDTGEPKEYRSELVICDENNQELAVTEVLVNHPFRFNGINIFQSSFGKIPDTYHNEAPEEISLEFQDTQTHLIFPVTTKIGIETSMPEGNGSFTIKTYQSDFAYGGHVLGPTLFIVLNKVQTNTQSDASATMVILPIKYPHFDKMRRGQYVISVSNPDQFLVTKNEDLYYTGLQVNRDPGVLFVYFGFILMLSGIYISFFMSHQKIRVILKALDNQTAIHISGYCNKNTIGMKQRINRFQKKL